MRRERKALIRILSAFVIFLAAAVSFHLTPLKSVAEAAKGWHVADPLFYLYAVPFLVAYAIVGYDVVYKAARGVVRGRFLDENFLMVVATFGAIALLDLPEACGVMLFYQVGELFQRYAVGKSRRSIAALMDIRPETARVLREGEEVILAPEEVAVGDVLILRAGERVPLDGVVTEGQGSFDVSSLTGESLPFAFEVGDEALSGAINLEGEIKIRATKAYADSTVAKILDLVENAATRKAKAENYITKFARYYTPIVVGAALLLAVIPPIFLGGWKDWINRALTFLVVSCPCALVISVPLSFFGGIGGASKRGVLIKGGGALERLAKVDTFLFDKTGTITKGSFEVSEVYPAERREEILAAAAIAESASNHPIARSVMAYAPATDHSGYEIREIAGRGVIAVGEEEILVGNGKLLEERLVEYSPLEKAGTVLYVARGGKYLGAIVVSDLPKENAAEVIGSLHSEGCRTVMLTGDAESVARAVAERVGVDEYHAGLLPQDKVAYMEALLAARKDEKKGVCFVGDGINDAPVLALADVGISMGGIGSDAAIEASDIVLLHDDLSAIPTAKRNARRTMRIVRENIGLALGVKVAVLALTAFGVLGALSMWLAVFADVGVAMLAILNAMRCLK